MFVLKLLSYVGIAFAFLFLTLAIASGLYFISEQVEEHTVFTKRLLTRIIYVVIAVHVLLLLFDGFPLKSTLFSIGANLVYLQNLKRFPFISLTSGIFITSCLCVLLNHYLWFRFFTDPSIPPYAIYRSNPFYEGPVHPPFAQVASFLGLCVWLIPFSLFISLSASDNVLPTSAEPSSSMQFETETGAEKARRQSTGLAKSLINYVYGHAVTICRAAGYELDPNSGRIA